MTQHDTRAGAQARSAAPGPHHDAAPEQHPGSTWAAPGAAPRQHPNAVSGPPRPVSSASPVPYLACSAPALFRGLPQEPRNKKSARIATFFRLGIVAWRQNAIRSPKTQQKTAVFGPEGAERSPQSQKSCKDIEFFVFAMGPIAATG